MRGKPRVLVTGGGGQLATAIQNLEDTGFIFKFATRSELDLTKPDQVAEFIAQWKPDVIINTAAYTQVDQAEEKSELAYSINEGGVKNLIEAIEGRATALIHLSTDYVFDGQKRTPYTEEDQPNPISVYGASKRAGEEVILRSKLKKYAIVRSSWVYSEYGHNFYKSVLAKAQRGMELRVVGDQIGSPTSASSLAAALITMIPQMDETNKGIYHFSNEGSASWYAFAKAIVQQDFPTSEVTPIPTSHLALTAKRPAYAVLDSCKIKSMFGVANEPWEVVLNKMQQ
ncbi:dTDP-4-dehydrorhamnose reductase [Croceiramulus getboli]|nr:dTDP-4-dehydrorhamnose reductase [Flavobacteriaceae bacterium YJPT1-3]